jgi:hypothetical protein
VTAMPTLTRRRFAALVLSLSSPPLRAGAADAATVTIDNNASWAAAPTFPAAVPINPCSAADPLATGCAVGRDTFSSRTAAYLKYGCFETGSQPYKVSSFAARGRPGSSQ